MKNCIVSAASYNHGASLLQFLDSLKAAGTAQPTRVFVFDLGLGNDTKQALRRFPSAELSSFDFETHPPHFNIAIARGQYAWKPVIIQRVLGKCDSVLWLDAGDRVTPGALDNAFKYLRNSDNGFLSTQTSGNVGTWVHQGMRTALAQQGFEARGDAFMCNGAIIGIANNHPRDPVNKIVVPWVRCAMNRSCIAPAGSSRKNHRQDQAALTVLAHSSGFGTVCGISEGHWTASGMVPGPLGIQIHQDERVRDRPLIGTGSCGCYYDGDQKRSVALLNMPTCAKNRCGSEPLYYFPASSLAGPPNLRAFGRAPPVVNLFAEKVPSVSPMVGVGMGTYASANAALTSMPALFATMRMEWEFVVVVDRVTTQVDDSLDVMRQVVDRKFRASSCVRVQIIDQSTPIGETSANNLAMRSMSPQFAYVLVQPDMLFYESNWAAVMLRAMKHDATMFALSGRCAHSQDGSHKVGRCGSDIEIPLSTHRLRGSRELEYRETANRGPLMLHASTTRKLGMLNEARFFLENDDHDLIHRAASQSLPTIGAFARIQNWIKRVLFRRHPHIVRPLRTRAAYVPIGVVAPLNLSSRHNLIVRAPAEMAYIAHRTAG